MLISKDNVSIRDWNSRDAYDLERIANNPNIARNMSDLFASPFEEYHARRIIEEGLTNKRYYAIDYQDKLVGGIGLRKKNRDKKHARSLEYWIAEDHWGKGIAPVAVKLFTGYAFQTFSNIERIEAKVYTWNEASKRVLEKTGYKYEGTLNKSTCKNQKLVDEWVYAILKSDFVNQNTSTSKQL